MKSLLNLTLIVSLGAFGMALSSILAVNDIQNQKSKTEKIDSCLKCKNYHELNHPEIVRYTPHAHLSSGDTMYSGTTIYSNRLVRDSMTGQTWTGGTVITVDGKSDGQQNNNTGAGTQIIKNK